MERDGAREVSEEVISQGCDCDHE